MSGYESRIETRSVVCLPEVVALIDKLQPQAKPVNGKSPADQAQTLPNAGKVGSGGTHWAGRRDRREDKHREHR